jgi:hypothetical protein
MSLLRREREARLSSAAPQLNAEESEMWIESTQDRRTARDDGREMFACGHCDG